MGTIIRSLLWAGLMAGLGFASSVMAEVPAVLSLSQAGIDAPQMLPRVSPVTSKAPLSFELAIQARCPSEKDSADLLVAITQTTRSISLEQAAGNSSLVMQIGLQQLPWLANPSARCQRLSESRIADAVAEDGARLFRLRAVTTAVATLHCAGEGSESSAATSALPLDAWLSCPRPETAARD